MTQASTDPDGTSKTNASSRDKPRAIWRRNLIVWGALVLLVLLTLRLAYVPLGALNLPIALAIAAVKALLVAIMFMELRFAKPFIRIAASVGVAWLLIMFSLTFSDELWRVAG